MAIEAVVEIEATEAAEAMVAAEVAEEIAETEAGEAKRTSGEVLMEGKTWKN